ncbi:CHAP domain containing protein, putative [Angomonas deanei]|uniref:CHAP domain containing protein, putative n=1 Tax=Angomonas deanei TaxID=59799 RepID=A0A7G2CSM5_9TRYP|nr:CHAP domain containing protein, putative [Angomonas deanei]
MLDYFINVSVPKSSGTPLRFPEEVNEFVSYQDDHTLTLRSGMQWQCVEYARRYWMLAGKPEPAFFGGVVGAEDIWTELQDAYYLNGSTTPLLKYTNKVSDVAPKTGDLIIYPRDGPDGEFPYGHVSVVGAVEGEKVFIAEQNFHSEPWPGPYHNYSRVLTLRQDSTTGRFELYDSVHSILGWIAY